jgi:hypothetical protein
VSVVERDAELKCCQFIFHAREIELTLVSSAAAILNLAFLLACLAAYVARRVLVGRRASRRDRVSSPDMAIPQQTDKKQR